MRSETRKRGSRDRKAVRDVLKAIQRVTEYALTLRGGHASAVQSFALNLIADSLKKAPKGTLKPVTAKERAK